MPCRPVGHLYVYSICCLKKKNKILIVFSHFVRAFNLLGRWAGLGYNTDEPSKHYVPTTSVRASIILPRQAYEPIYFQPFQTEMMGSD